MTMTVAMIGQAVKDLYRRQLTGIKDHISAICWLGSKDSTKWFDIAKVDQAAALHRLQWPEYAEDILSNDEVILSDDQRRMLVKTLEYLQDKSGKA